MQTFLMWWSNLSGIPAFGRAKLFAVFSAANIAAIVYFTLTGDFGWVIPLILIFFVLFSTCMEQLGFAFRVAGQLQIEEYQDEEEYDGDTEDWYASLLNSIQSEPQAESAPTNRTAVEWGEFADYTEEGMGDEIPGSEMSESEKLALCQFYVFVYCVVKHKLVGESVWMSGVCRNYNTDSGYTVWQHHQSR